MSQHILKQDNPESQGRWDATMYLQTLADHGEVITPLEAGAILAGQLLDLYVDMGARLMRAAKEGEPEALALASEKLNGFAEVLAGVLWDAAEDKRQAAMARQDGRQVATVIGCAIDNAAKRQKGGAA